MTRTGSKLSTAETMKLVGGRLCLDFANTVGGRTPSASGHTIRSDKLSGFRDLALWSRHAGFISDHEMRRMLQEEAKQPARAGAVFKRAIRLREAVYRICMAAIQSKQPSPSDVEILNVEIRIARSHETLERSAGRFSWKWAEATGHLDRILWPIALSTAELLTGSDLTRLRQCGGDSCGWLFEDTSKNHSRQWCDMRDCGNIAKVRRFRSRKRPR